MAQSLNDFIAAQTGKPVSFPNCLDNQCMTLLHVYLQQCFDLTDPTLLANPNAYEVYTNYPQENGSQYFNRVENAPNNVPNPGDIVVFAANNNIAQTGENGHVCIFVSGDVNNFTSFDCNYPAGSLPHLQLHTYDGVLGWLTPRPQGTFVDTQTFDKLVTEAKEFEAFLTAGYQSPNDVVSKVSGYEKTITDLQSQLGQANQTVSNLQVEIQQNKDQMAKLADITQQQATSDSTAIDTGLQASQSLKNITLDMGLIVGQLNENPNFNTSPIVYPPVNNVTSAISHLQNQLRAAQTALTRAAQENELRQKSQLTADKALKASKGFFSQITAFLQKVGILEVS